MNKKTYALSEFISKSLCSTGHENQKKYFPPGLNYLFV